MESHYWNTWLFRITFMDLRISFLQNGSKISVIMMSGCDIMLLLSLIYLCKSSNMILVSKVRIIKSYQNYKQNITTESH